MCQSHRAFVMRALLRRTCAKHGSNDSPGLTPNCTSWHDNFLEAMRPLKASKEATGRLLYGMYCNLNMFPRIYRRRRKRSRSGTRLAATVHSPPQWCFFPASKAATPPRGRPKWSCARAASPSCSVRGGVLAAKVRDFGSNLLKCC